jgi:hypothetical protein
MLAADIVKEFQRHHFRVGSFLPPKEIAMQVLHAQHSSGTTSDRSSCGLEGCASTLLHWGPRRLPSYFNFLELIKTSPRPLLKDSVQHSASGDQAPGQLVAASGRECCMPFGGLWSLLWRMPSSQPIRLRVINNEDVHLAVHEAHRASPPSSLPGMAIQTAPQDGPALLGQMSEGWKLSSVIERNSSDAMYATPRRPSSESLDRAQSIAAEGAQGSSSSNSCVNASPPWWTWATIDTTL